MSTDFPHLDQHGHARMVDVTGKATTDRRASACARVFMQPATAKRVAAGDLPAGDVLAAARTAGVLAAKRVPELLPLCHPVLIGAVTLDFGVGEGFVEVVAQVEALDRTGVEMEALTACSAAALTIYAACKSADRTMAIGELSVLEKSGGRSGTWVREPSGAVRHLPAPSGGGEAG